VILAQAGQVDVGRGPLEHAQAQVGRAQLIQRDAIDFDAGQEQGEPMTLVAMQVIHERHQGLALQTGLAEQAVELDGQAVEHAVAHLVQAQMGGAQAEEAPARGDDAEADQALVEIDRSQARVAARADHLQPGADPEPAEEDAALRAAFQFLPALAQEIQIRQRFQADFERAGGGREHRRFLVSVECDHNDPARPRGIRVEDARVVPRGCAARTAMAWKAT